MSHDRDKPHDCKMVDLNIPYNLRDWRVDNKGMAAVWYEKRQLVDNH